MTLNDYLVSTVRTVTPMAAGVVLEWVAKRTGIVVPTAQVAPYVAAAGAAVYYGLVRLAEQKWPRVGWLLGWATTPTYKPAAPVAVTAPTDGKA